MGQAESITASHGGRIWTLVLHPHMKFSDGTPFNAAAVCDQITRDANPATGSVFASQASTTGCAAVNKTTVKFTLPSPNYYWPAVISQDFPFISSPTAVAAEGTQFAASPVGAGPFVLATNVSGVTQSYVRNKYYSLFAPGQPYLDGITIESSGTLSQIVSALASGQAQISTPINTQYATEERAAGMQAAMHSTAGGAFLAINTSIPPFNNVLARQAVYDVINRQGVADVWAPGNPVTTNLFPTTSPFYNKKYNFPPGNLAQAQSDFNTLAAAGTPVKFSLLWPTTTAPATAAYIQSEFAGMSNVTVTLDMETQNQYVALRTVGNYQMTPTGLYDTELIPAIQQYFQTGGSLNIMRWSDPKADTALVGLYSDRTFASQVKDWDAFMTELNTQYPVIWTQQGRIGVAYNPKLVAGIQAVEFGNATLWGSVHLL
jgi:ABC-type transport system substrate-binding protein